MVAVHSTALRRVSTQESSSMVTSSTFQFQQAASTLCPPNSSSSSRYYTDHPVSLLENVLKPSTHLLDTTLDTTYHRWSHNGARELTPRRRKMGPVSQCFSLAITRPHYTAARKVLETQANRVAYKLGLDPHVIARKIKSYFGDAEQRVQPLELLRATAPPKLKKLCSKLVKYSLPTESANTQCQAFKEIIDLVTLFPGLRVLFLQTKVLDNTTLLDAMSELGSR
ncbi:hypothetical protein B0H14DRAFT_2655118 [Mycena olivaceomarginata]|nr:hypothetical protein B0H14DRAFT_2655118 [Mycena olivaceomarginata]